MNAKIIGLGKYLPEKILTNADFEKMVETSDEWITKRVGIKQRHISAENEYTSDLASRAAEEALKNAGMSAEELDLIVLATVTPDMYTPSVACLVQKNIGATNAVAFDINAACSGFVFAMTTANQYIQSGMFKNVLVIGADALSKVTEYKDRATCVLFGDGAGAAVLTATEENTGILGSVMGADGANGDVLTAPGIRCDEIELERRPFGNPRTIWMDGSAVFKFAVRVMAASVQEVVEKADKTMEDVALVVPHQANMRIIEGAAKRLSLRDDQMYVNVDTCGNMSSASIPVALCEAVEKGCAKKDDLIAMVGMGGGLTWGSVLVEL